MNRLTFAVSVIVLATGLAGCKRERERSPVADAFPSTIDGVYEITATLEAGDCAEELAGSAGEMNWSISIKDSIVRIAEENGAVIALGSYSASTGVLEFDSRVMIDGVPRNLTNPIREGQLRFAASIDFVTSASAVTPPNPVLSFSADINETDLNNGCKRRLSATGSSPELDGPSALLPLLVQQRIPLQQLVSRDTRGEPNRFDSDCDDTLSSDATFMFEAPADGSYRLRVAALDDDSAPIVTVLEDDGVTPIACVSSPTLDFDLDQDGRVIISVAGAAAGEEESRAFELTVEVGPQSPCADAVVGLGQTIRTIDDVGAFEFVAPSAGTYDFNASGSSFYGGDMELRDSDCDEILASGYGFSMYDDLRLTVTLAAGQVVVFVILPWEDGPVTLELDISQ